MINLQKPDSYKLVTIITVFNLVILFIDWILVYLSSREVEKLYSEIGIDAIFNVGVYFFKLRAIIIIVGSFVALLKFWEMKNRKPGVLDKWILRIAFVLLISGTIAALETFVETIIRIL